MFFNLKSKIVTIASFMVGCASIYSFNYLYFFYNTVPYVVPIQDKVEMNFQQTDVIFMYQKNRTDDTFYKMLSYSNNIIFIGDQKWKCVISPCLELQKEYGYKTLDLKLVDALTQLLNKFPPAKTFAKLDDDALVHPHLYYDLIKKFEPNNYAGLLRNYVVDGAKLKFIFMEGRFYMLGREIVECFLKNSRIAPDNMGEDLFLGKVVSNYCNVKYINVEDANMIWHRQYSTGKNKNCNLEQQYPNDTN